jgi:threonine dehydrogenase-like Zn-dependent dehydrogenase
MEYIPKIKNGRAFVQVEFFSRILEESSVILKGDGMLGLYTIAVLRELGYETIYCSGNRIRRAEFVKRFGAIPIYNGKIFI